MTTPTVPALLRPLLALCVAAACVACGAERPAPQEPSSAAGSDSSSSAPAAPDDGPVLHAAPLGTDGGTGSADDPFGSLQHALDQLEAGDTLLLAGGTYEEDVEVDAAPGRRDAPVRVRPAPGEEPLLQGLLWLTDPDWWQVQGLSVTWDDDNDADEHMVKIDGGEHWVLSDAEIWGARSYAAVLVVGDPSDYALRRLYVHDTYETNGENQDHLIYLNAGKGGGVVEGCLLVGSRNGRAVKIGPAEDDGPSVSNVQVRYNTMVDNRGPSNVQLAWRSSDNEVYRNVMVRAGRGRNNVTDFELEGDGNVVRENIGWESEGVLPEDVDGLEDGGGNKHLDPELDDVGGRSYVPTAEAAEGYGHTALPRT